MGGLPSLGGGKSEICFIRTKKKKKRKVASKLPLNVNQFCENFICNLGSSSYEKAARWLVPEVAGSRNER